MESPVTLVEVERACFENCSLHKSMLHTYLQINADFDLEQPTMHTRAQKASSDSEGNEKRRIEDSAQSTG